MLALPPRAVSPPLAYRTRRARALPVLLGTVLALALAACDANAPGGADSLALAGVPDDGQRTRAAAPGCPCFDQADVQNALAFNREWVTMWDATFGSFSEGTRHVLLDNDVPGAVWTLGVERKNGVHACRYNLYTPRVHRRVDSLSVAQADACRALVYEVMPCGGGSVYGASNSCGRRFAWDIERRVRALAGMPQRSADKLRERARLLARR